MSEMSGKDKNYAVFMQTLERAYAQKAQDVDPTVEERDALRARVAELEQERDGLAASLDHMATEFQKVVNYLGEKYNEQTADVRQAFASGSVLVERLKAQGAADELERLADTTVNGWHAGGELRDMVMTQDHKLPGLDVFSPAHLVISLRARCAQLRQEAEL
jgi:hypothetical protein